MIILEDNFNIKFQHNTYVALGSFDGLHLGHLSLIKKVKELSKQANCKSMIYTFKNHPMTLINKSKLPKLIQSNEDKVEILKDEGIDILNFATFDLNHMKMDSEEFIYNLIKNYNVKGIVVGFNYKFGNENLGDVKLLNELSKKYNFDLCVCPPISFEDNIISSTFIRKLIQNGEVKKVKNFLGRYFSISGEVIEGRKIGRTMGFPTVNLKYDENLLLPQRGVYYTVAIYKDKLYKGISNIGYNPTVNGDHLSVETNILNFHEDIYGDEIRIFFIEKLREEKKFNSLDELKSTLNRDKQNVEKKEIKL